MKQNANWFTPAVSISYPVIPAAIRIKVRWGEGRVAVESAFSLPLWVSTENAGGGMLLLHLIRNRCFFLSLAESFLSFALHVYNKSFTQ